MWAIHASLNDERPKMSVQAKRRPFNAGGAGEGNPLDFAFFPLPCTHVGMHSFIDIYGTKT